MRRGLHGKATYCFRTGSSATFARRPHAAAGRGRRELLEGTSEDSEDLKVVFLVNMSKINLIYLDIGIKLYKYLHKTNGFKGPNIIYNMYVHGTYFFVNS